MRGVTFPGKAILTGTLEPQLEQRLEAESIRNANSWQINPIREMV